MVRSILFRQLKLVNYILMDFTICKDDIFCTSKLKKEYFFLFFTATDLRHKQL